MTTKDLLSRNLKCHLAANTARDRRPCNAYQLATDAQVMPAVVYRILAGKQGARAETIRKLAQALGGVDLLAD